MEAFIDVHCDFGYFELVDVRGYLSFHRAYLYSACTSQYPSAYGQPTGRALACRRLRHSAADGEGWSHVGVSLSAATFVMVGWGQGAEPCPEP